MVAERFSHPLLNFREIIMRKLDSNELQHVYGGGKSGGCKSGSGGKSKTKTKSKTKSHSHGGSKSRSGGGGCGC